MSQPALSLPATLSSGAIAEIESRVRQLAAASPTVTAAYVSPDGEAFVLTGRTWDEGLAAAAADLGVELQFSLAPQGPLLDGIYREAPFEAPTGWRQVAP